MYTGDVIDAYDLYGNIQSALGWVSIYSGRLTTTTTYTIVLILFPLVLGTSQFYSPNSATRYYPQYGLMKRVCPGCITTHQTVYYRYCYHSNNN